jgi:membrane protein
MIKKLLKKIGELPLVRNVVAIAHKVTPPGFEGHSLYDVSAFFIRGTFKGGIQSRASAMAFSFFLAVFPSIIFLFTIIPYIPVHNFQTTLLGVLHELLPENMFNSLEDAIDEIMAQPSRGLLSFGFLAALYFSKNGLVAMMNGFNNSIHVKETRPVWKQQLIATTLVLVLTIVIFTGLFLMIGTEYALQTVVEKQSAERIWINIGKWVILGALFFAIIGTFYRFGPAKRRHRNFISPGVILATLLIIGTSVVFSWYVNNFGKYNSIYGSLGTVLVVCLWIYFNSVMLLIGFELDAGIYSAREKHRSLLEQEELESAVQNAAEEEAEKAVREA